MDTRAQLLLSGATIVGVVYVWNEIQSRNIAAQIAKGRDMGIDPNWTHGAPIQRTGPVDTHDSKKPSCQVWDNDIQLFVNSGDPDSDADQQVCWQKNPNAKQPRYIDKDGNISFRTDDPFNEPSENHGVCYFDSNGETDTFPDIIAIAPPNRSERLCFASTSDPAEVPKYFINKLTGQLTYSPYFVAGDSPGMDDNLAAFDSNPEAASTESTFCEQRVQVGNETVWANTTEVSSLRDVDTCLDHTSTQPIRFHNRKTKTLVYKNPFTGEKIMTTYE